MHELRRNQITEALSCSDRLPHLGSHLETNMTEVASRINCALGPNGSRVKEIGVSNLFVLSNPNPSCSEIAAGVVVTLVNNAKYELIISEYIGMRSVNLTEDNGFYVAVSEPRYGMALKGHKILGASDLPEAEQQFLAILRIGLEALNN